MKPALEDGMATAEQRRLRERTIFVPQAWAIFKQGLHGGTLRGAVDQIFER